MAILSGAAIYLQRGACVDDAYVSFVYARNLARGNGLVFNLGERVEGYSNFLWVIMLAGLNRFFGVPIPQTAQIIGAILGILNVLLVFSLARRILGDANEKWAFAAAMLTAMDYRVASWSIRGLETPLYLFFVLAAIRLYMFQRWRWLWSIPALGAALTRPEGPILFGALAIHRIAVLIREKRFPDKADIGAAAVFSIPFIAYTAWRMTYFGGFLVPNTYYARGGAGPFIGMLYIMLESWRAWGPVLVIFVPVAIYALFKGNADVWLILVWAIVAKVFVIIAGGDWMPNARFLVPIIPALFILCAFFCANISRRWLRIGIISLLFAVQIGGLFIYETRPSFDKLWSQHQDEFYMPVARKLDQLGARGQLVALSDIGYVTYYSGIRVIDTLGLVDRHLARMRGGPEWSTDLDYVIGRRPVYVVTMVRRYGKVEIGHTAFDREALVSPIFLENYKLETIVPGYHASELSFDDFRHHDYDVEFRIWRRQGA